MYQNGKRVNGYNKKCLHKVKQKKKYMKMYWYGTGEVPYKTWDDFMCKYKGSPYSKTYKEYWHYYEMSSLRKTAKRETNRKIRRKYNINKNLVPYKYDYMDVYYDCVNLDTDYADMPLNTEKGLYKREFDYMWYIY